MSEQSRVWGELQQLGGDSLFAWACETAFGRVGQDYDQPAGHDQTVVGQLGYKYFINLFDRATSSGAFALPEGAAALGRDRLREGITQEAFEQMPDIAIGSFRRSNFNGSPGWAWGQTRFLLQSFPFGGIDSIAWSQKSPTKQIVAGQGYVDEDQVLIGWEALGEDEAPTDSVFTGLTLIFAHSFDRDSGAYEAYLGNSRRHAHRGDGAWNWRRLVAKGGGSAGGGTSPTVIPDLPGAPPSPVAPDTEVRVRGGGRRTGTGPTGN